MQKTLSIPSARPAVLLLTTATLAAVLAGCGGGAEAPGGEGATAPASGAPARVEPPPPLPERSHHDEEEDHPPLAPLPKPQGPRSWHGMSMANLKGVPEGAPEGARCQVTHVYRGSPAERSGVREDDLILSIDGKPVERFQDVGRALRGRPPGSRHPMTVWRDGRRQELTLVMDARPEDMSAWQRSQWIGRPHVPFELVRFPEGGPLRSSEYGGRLIVLDFWATWCAPCRAAMPRLDALQRRYGEKGLQVIGITSEEEPVIRSFLARTPVSYLIGRDPYGEVKQDYEVNKLPTLVVIGKDGRVLSRATGSEGGVEQAERLAAELL